MIRLGEAFDAASLVLTTNSQVEEALEFLLAKTEKPRILELRISQDDVPPFNKEASLKF
jgi:hypothetical protein